jgi:peptidoglycan/xylan/chitin deacetylase (PgdA/CDA1 family)
MRKGYAVGLALVWMTIVQAEGVLAEAPCATDPHKLGVARVATIDAAAGPRFGVQYRDASFLNDGEVVLTFDDGPSRAYTRPILDALAAHCTKATFFMVGRMALADPAMVKEVAEQGHTIATHTWSHANLHSAGPRGAESEIEMGISAVRYALGSPIAPFFRFPYLRDTNGALHHLAGRDVAIFSIDVDSKDFLTTNPASVVERVLRELAAKRKGIILLHDIHASTARAMPTLLAELKARRYKVVHIRPKTDVQTVAEYDAQAAQQADRRRVANVRTPLAKRTLTWPTTVMAPTQAERAPPRAPQREREDNSDWIAKILRW